MEILIAGGAAALAAAIAWMMRGRQRVLQPAEKGLAEAPPARRPRGDMHAGATARQAPQHEDREETAQEAPAPAGPASTSDTAEELVRLRERLEHELAERRAEISRIEERILQREESLERRLSEVDTRERALNERDLTLERRAEELQRAGDEHLRALEGVAGLSRAQAKQALAKELEAEARHDVARTVRQIEEEARRDAARQGPQHPRSRHAATRGGARGGDHRVGRRAALRRHEGSHHRPRGAQHPRAREHHRRRLHHRRHSSAVVLSAFDGVRRQIAKLTLEKLVQDGRIHPARIEEAFYQARSEIENHIVEQGEQALFEANVHSIHPELVKLLGRLKYRTSYGQNVLSHSIEVARLAAMMADELGASPKTARRAALLHDIGKAVSHETEGPHALVGGELARRYGEPEAVAHAMEAHHNEVEMQTVEAVIVQTADALSGARPGARGESLEHYVKRLKDLEEVASRRGGVEKVYAMQAGREIRVMVSPGALSDDEAAMLSHEIARDIERELEYPGQIKVTVIRESRAVDFAK